MRILAASSPGEVRIAVMDGDALCDYAIWRPGAPDGLGDLHLGRVTARVPAMAGAFVALADSDGFLPDSEGAAGACEGDLLTVRITRTAQGGKGPRLAGTQDQAEACGPPRLIARGPDPLHRLAACHPSAAIVTDDHALLARLPPSLRARASHQAVLFDDDIEAGIDTLGQPVCDLPGGMRASFVPTPALVAIDLDGGATTGARGAKGRVQMQANRAAIPALARQIRLRNLAGAILVDFAGLPMKARASLAPDLILALAPDPAGARLLGFTHLGLAEILRPRRAPPLHELLAGPHAAGLAALRQIARDGPPRARLRADPAIISALKADPVALPDLARRAVNPLILHSDPALTRDAWIIEDAA